MQTTCEIDVSQQGLLRTCEGQGVVLARCLNIRFAAVGRTATKVLAQLSLRDPGGLGHEVILFRHTRCPSGRNSVVLDGAFVVANHFEQMGANRVETIVTGKPAVVIERSQKFETFRRTVYHRGGNCMIERDHGAGGYSLQQFVQRKDLWPIRVFHSCGLVMNGSNRRL
jgi:hypothetical protein